MVYISFIEVFNILVATLGVGYIFTGLFPVKLSKRDIIDSYKRSFDWHEFWLSCLFAAPGVILHEMSHKFVAMSFGLNAFFEVSYFGLFFGILFKLLGSGFILLAPGYVIISGVNAWQGMITAFAGPLLNLLLWVLAIIILKKSSSMTRGRAIFWSVTKEMNKWLFIFNMLPIPPLDGFKVWIPLFKLIIGIF